MLEDGSVVGTASALRSASRSCITAASCRAPVFSATTAACSSAPVARSWALSAAHWRSVPELTAESSSSLASRCDSASRSSETCCTRPLTASAASAADHRPASAATETEGGVTALSARSAAEHNSCCNIPRSHSLSLQLSAVTSVCSAAAAAAPLDCTSGRGSGWGGCCNSKVVPLPLFSACSSTSLSLTASSSCFTRRASSAAELPPPPPAAAGGDAVARPARFSAAALSSSSCLCTAWCTAWSASRCRRSTLTSSSARRTRASHSASTACDERDTVGQRNTFGHPGHASIPRHSQPGPSAHQTGRSPLRQPPCTGRAPPLCTSLFQPASLRTSLSQAAPIRAP